MLDTYLLSTSPDDLSMIIIDSLDLSAMCTESVMSYSLAFLDYHFAKAAYYQIG